MSFEPNPISYIARAAQMLPPSPEMVDLARRAAEAELLYPVNEELYRLTRSGYEGKTTQAERARQLFRRMTKSMQTPIRKNIFHWDTDCPGWPVFARPGRNHTEALELQYVNCAQCRMRGPQ